MLKEIHKLPGLNGQCKLAASRRQLRMYGRKIGTGLLMAIIGFLAASGNASAQAVAQIGTGNLIPADALYSPFYRFSNTSTTANAKSNILITEAEMMAAGIPAGATITQLVFNKTNAGNFVSDIPSFEMLVANSNKTTLSATTTWANILSTHTSVFSAAPYNLPNAAGWVNYSITPFVYTGGSFEIATTHDRGGIASTGDGFKWEYSAGQTGPTYVIAATGNTTNTSVLSASVAAYYHRPNVRIVYTPNIACSGTPSAGVASSSATTICPNSTFTLSLSGTTAATGIDIQWQSSATGAAGTFSNVPGATSTYYDATQAATTYYRARVTCNGANEAFSNTVQVISPVLVPTSSFTIDKNSPASATNFQSFAAAINSLSCGIAGTVTFNVVANSGPYTGRVVIPVIQGASASNRVIFNGNGNTLTNDGVASADRSTVTLNEADYITINDFNIVASNTTYGWGVHLMGDADNNQITNNTITIASTSTTTSNTAAIVASGSATSVTTAGGADNTLISGNTTIGGYNTILFIGGSAIADLGMNNTISDNIVQDYYETGIDLTGQNGAVVSGNNISRPTRTSTTTHHGIEISGTNTRGLLIEKNRIHNTFDAMLTSTSTAYGISVTSNDAPSTEPNLIVNNLIYNMNSSGTIYGFYNSGSDNVKYYHNTVSLDETNASTSSATYGFYNTTTATGLEIVNNIFSVTRGGTGNRRALYFNSTGASATTFTESNNVLYVNSATGSNAIAYVNPTTYTTLNDWQGAGYGNGSVDSNPQFANIANNNYQPTNAAVDNIGTDVGITEDITDAARDAAQPDAGAIEFEVLSCSGAPNAGTASSSVATVCIGTDFELLTAGFTIALGVDIQWQSSATGAAGTFTNIAGATGPSVTISQLGSTFYRAMATCNGSNPAYSNIVEVQSPALIPATTFTVNKNAPVSSTSFQSLSAAVNAISCGISGPIIINITPGSGPYTEQVVFPEIYGTSATNTIVVNGGGNTLEFAATVTGERAVLYLAGADYVTIDNLMINASAGTYGYGIQLINGSDYITISNNTITSDLTATSSNFAGIVASGSLSGAVTDGVNANNILITGNTIIGGYYGITLNGDGATGMATNNHVVNNTIRDFYLYGVYLDDQESALVSGNDIHRTNRTVTSTFYGVYLSGAASKNNLVEKNRIHDTQTANQASTSLQAGIWFTGADATASEPNMAVNNIIYNINGAGIIYGLYNTGSDYASYYHNSVSLNDVASTSTAVTYGFYQTTTATGLEIKNNIFSITRGGTGTKRAIYFKTLI
ncbi:MAG: hypothetical protein EOP51_18005, partial [Sphingobacteriales bacterium]